jgi:hypothetical protein
MLPQLGFLIFFDKIFLVNLINHNLYGVEISAFSILFYFFDFFKNNQHFRSGNFNKFLQFSDLVGGIHFSTKKSMKT